MYIYGLYCSLFAGGLAICIFTYLYNKVPVSRLRSSWSYTTPCENLCRQAGLNLPGNTLLNEIPREFLLILLVAEDRHFFMHRGFDFSEMRIALTDALFKGKKLRGGSTITQQLAKNFFLTTKRSIRRKIVEAIYTLRLEREFSKSELLTLYINNIEWGDSIYGISQAATYYFNKSPSQLVLEEILFLVSIVPAPRIRGAGFRQGATPPQVWKLYIALATYFLSLKDEAQIATFLRAESNEPLDNELSRIDLKRLQFGHDRESRAHKTARAQILRPVAVALCDKFKESIFSASDEQAPIPANW